MLYRKGIGYLDFLCSTTLLLCEHLLISHVANCRELSVTSLFFFFTLDFMLHFVLVADIVLVGVYLSSPNVGSIFNALSLLYKFLPRRELFIQGVGIFDCVQKHASWCTAEFCMMNNY